MSEDRQRDEQKGADLEGAIQAVVRAAVANLHTAMPGIVRSFNPTTQTAVVAPAIKRMWLDEGPKALPECVDVPVFFPRGGGFVLTFPVAEGDECLLVFGERAIDNWFNNGGVQEPSAVVFHDLSDAFALVGFSSRPRALTNVSADGAELRTLDGQTLFRVDPSGAYVGGRAGAESTFKGTSLSAKLVTLLGAFSAYLPTIQPIADPTGTATTTMLTAITDFLAALPATLTTKARVL